MQKKVFVTGAGRGMGLETVQRLLDFGFYLLAAARNLDTLLSLKERYGKNLELVQLDLFDRGQIEQAGARLRKLSEEGAPLDVLIHNAGVYPGGKFPEHDVGRLMTVNFFAPLQLTRLALPAMAKGGRVLNISSGLGRLSSFSPQAARALLEPLSIEEVETLARRYVKEGAMQGWPSDPYSVSKALLNALTRAFSTTYKDQTFVSIDPGWVRTDMGGEGAPNSLEQGVETTIWAATTEVLESNHFYHHRERVSW